MALRRENGYRTKRITRKSRFRRTTPQGQGTSELVTVAEPVIPIAPWLSGPFLYGAGLFLHYLWLSTWKERLSFSVIFAVAGAVIGMFAISYGKARTEFQRGHAGITPVLFSLIISVPLNLGWGKYSSLVMLTYWFVLSGGWVARVARSVWGDGADMHKADPAAAVGETFGLPGMQVHDPYASAPLARRDTGVRQRVIKMTELLPRPVRPEITAVVEDLEETDFDERADEDLDPSRFVDGSPDDLDVLEGVVTRQVTVRGTQGYEDILKALPGLRNAARAVSATAQPIPGNPQAAMVTLVLRDFLTDLIPYPGPSQPNGSRSVEVCVGVRADGHRQRFPLSTRQGTWRGIIAGESGAGKSRWLWNLAAELSNRSGFVIWACDTAKAKQTLGPLMEMVDWAALTEEDAFAMVEALKSVITARADALADDGDRQIWDPSCKFPLLIFICEEFANIAKLSKRMANMITRLSEQARSAGIMLVFSLQRPSAENMPSGARSQMKNRFCLGLLDEQTTKMTLSAQTIAAGAKPQDVNVEEEFGTHWYEGPGFPSKDWSTKGRFYGIEADEVRRLAEAGRPWRSTLDEASTRAAGAAYANRKRTLIVGQVIDTDTEPTEDVLPAETAPTPNGDTGKPCSSLSVEPRAAEVVTEPQPEVRSGDEVLQDVLTDLADGTITTADLVSRWTQSTSLDRREMYRAIKRCPDLSSTTQKGLWILSRSRQRS